MLNATDIETTTDSQSYQAYQPVDPNVPPKKERKRPQVTIDIAAKPEPQPEPQPQPVATAVVEVHPIVTVEPLAVSCCSKVGQFFRKWKPLLLVCLFNVLQAVSQNAMLPILPGIKRRYFGGDKEAAFVQTLLIAISAVLGLFTAPLCGSLMDSFGRRPFFLVSSAFYIAPLAVFVTNIDNPLPMMILQAVGGLISGGFVNSYLADCYSPRLRITAFAAMQGVGTLTTVSTVLVFSMSDYGIILLSFSLQISAFLLVLFFIKESLPRARRQTFSLAAIHNPFKAMKSVITSKVILAALAILCVFSVAQSGVGEVYMYYLNERVGFQREDNALLMLGAGIASPFVMFVIVPILTRVFRLRHVTLIMISIVGLAFEMVALCLIFEKWEMYAFGLPSLAIVYVAFPALAAIIANGGPDEEQARRQTGLQAISDLFGALAPVFFGQTYSHLKGDWVMLPFILAGVACVPTFFLACKLRHWIIRGEGQTKDEDKEGDDDQVPPSTSSTGSSEDAKSVGLATPFGKQLSEADPLIA